MNRTPGAVSPGGGEQEAAPLSPASLTANDNNANDTRSTAAEIDIVKKSDTTADDPPADEKKPFTLFGHQVHLSFVRTYTAPLDIDWSAHSFDMYFGVMYKDSVVADQFRAFYFRSCLSITVGTVYAFAHLLAAVAPLVRREHTAVVTSAAGVLAVTMLVDFAIHLFAPSITPDIAKVRMVVAFIVGSIPLMYTDGWSTRSDLSACDDSWQLPHFAGRIDLTDEQKRWLCVRIFDPYQIGTITMASLGVIMYPIPHAVFSAAHFVICFFISRLFASSSIADEAPGEKAVAALLLLVSEAGAMGITYVRFSAARVAFETTIKVEMQRREAATRAAELQQLLHTIVPAAVLPRLEAGGAGQFKIDNVPWASMLFADMKGFTAWSSSRSAEAVTSMLNTVVAALDTLAVRTESVEKIKTVGDAYWAVSGIPIEAQNHADQLVLFGWRMNQIVAELNTRHAEWDNVSWRVAVHSGPMTGALFGERQVSYEVFGETSRVAQVAEARGISGSVVCTEQTLSVMLLRPEEKYLRAHEVVDGEGPSGGVLTMYEILEPQEDADSILPAILSTQASGMISPRGLQLQLLPPAVATIVSAPASSRASQRSVASSAAASRRNVPKRTVRLLRDTKKETDDNDKNNKSSDEIPFDDAALEALEKTKYPLLPYFADPDTEAQFKARSEVVCRNMNRVSSVTMLFAHLVYMVTLVALPERCFAAAGVTLQFAALIPYGASIVFAFHPTLSLRVSSAALVAAVFVGLIGTGLTALNGCVVGHDLQAYTFMAFPTIMYAAGPVSWPVLSLAVIAFVDPPATILALFFSPIPLGAGGFIPVGGVMTMFVAFIEERLLRRRFIEEELAKRGEAQLAVLGEQRSEVLQRLVPRHVVSDLVAWFGTQMDPDRSITRSYERIVIGFMRLRPGAIEELPRLHGDVDRDLLALHELSSNKAVADGSGICSPRSEEHQGQQDTSTISMLDKIKTVGDIVMVAGPFPPLDTDEIGASPYLQGRSIVVSDEEMLASFNAVVRLFAKVRAKCPVQVGAHLGPVVGTVQGSSRLAFDVFGDPVNVASRVLSGASASGSSMHVSGTLADFVEEALDKSVAVASFGPPTSVAAKGKGVLQVRPVVVS